MPISTYHSDRIILTVVQLSDGTYLHWKPVLNSADYHKIKKAMDRRNKCRAQTDWRRIIRAMIKEGKPCEVRILSNMICVQYDSTDTFHSTAQYKDWLRYTPRGRV